MGSPRRDGTRRRIYLSTWSVHRLMFAGAITIDSMPALAGAMGFEGVELEDIFFRRTDRRSIQSLRRLLKKHSQRVLIAVSNDFTVAGRERLAEQIVHAERFLRIAEALGSHVVRVLVGSGRPRVSAMDQVVEAMGAVAATAQKLGLAVAIENHDRLSRDPERLVRLVKDLGGSDVGICLDTGNFPARSRAQAIARCAPYALMVHAKAYAFRPNGEEKSLSYGRIAAVLDRVRFAGPLVVEYDGPGDQLLGSLRLASLVRKYLAPDAGQ